VDIFIVAGIAAGLTWLTFIFIDRRRKSITKNEVASQIVDDNDLNSGRSSLVLARDYTDYVMSKKEKALYILLAGVFFYIIGFIFYNNPIVALIIALMGLYYPRIRKRQIIIKQRQELSIQFKQALFSLSTALAAGKSVENSFRGVSQDIKILYPDPNAYIIREFDLITIKIENGETLESALSDFNERARLKDISNFTDVFITCKRTGGDLVEVIRKTSNIISDKLEIKQEISIMIAQKKFEAKILSFAPLVIVAVLSYSSPDYMAPLYQSARGGPIIMTVALLFLAFSYWMTKRIMDIKV
jgi:tight adherence protein B